MKLEIISPRHTEHIEEYSLYFQETKNGGLSFPCDKMGNVFTDQLHSVALENYKKAIADTSKFISVYIQDYSHNVRCCAIGKCSCGGTVYLDNGLSNSCDSCNNEYGMNGELFLPRSMWQEQIEEDY